LPGYGFRDALLQIPTVSLVLPHEDLFGSSGIYANPGARGDAWERAASMEWFQWDHGREFQENLGLSVRGGISRNKGFTPKHGFRVNFRGVYGAGSLDQALFPDTPVSGFDRLLLRAGSTDTWPCVEWGQLVDGVQRWYRREASNLRDQWVRDTQIAMGQPSAHGTYVHLYLNGLYWGVYNLCERPDHDFLALHRGGRAEEYDAVADFAELHAGNMDAWNRMMALAGEDLSVNANYQRLLGNRPDGTRDPASEVLLDVDNLIDYMVLHIFIGADDWPNHNWWAGRRRGPESTGFQFFAWDQEISISSLVRQHSSWGPIYAQADAFNTPAYVYSRCRSNPEFRMRFADRVYRHLFGSGALSVSNNIARWAGRVAGVDQAIVAESARWGDHQRPAQPYRREVEWLANDRWMRETYFPSNHVVALKRFRDAALYPRLAPPEWSSSGGLVSPGFQIGLRNPNASGTVWYTADGSDPRLPGGAVSASAVSETPPPPITARIQLRARVRDGNLWSALSEVTLVTAAEYTALVVSEVHYHPEPDPLLADESAEFLELFNRGNTALELAGLTFTEGIEFQFAAGTRLAPGAYAVVVRDRDGFTRRFPEVVPLGAYTGALGNGGETLTLGHAVGLTVFSFAYDDAPPWPPGADGLGVSLQRSDLIRPPGIPGAWVAAPPSPGVALNPALADSDADGLPDDWERLYGMDPLRNDAGDDADTDGRTALEEYLAGTHPEDPRSVLRLDVDGVRPDGGPDGLRFEAVAGRSYRVERREDLILGTWVPYARVRPEAVAHAVRLALPAEDARSHYRILTPDPEP
ncbi:MAG: CotH kinase family protein, partial [Verrucomicrobia bacterium]|nr:CotH kinase family protein [Verrucomicrobiota bacterium]